MLTTPQMRDLVKARAHVIEMNSAAVVMELTAIRDAYIAVHGLATYLSQILGSTATESASACCLHWDGGLQESPDSRAELQKFLKRLPVKGLPYKVVVQTGDGEIEKYL